MAQASRTYAIGFELDLQSKQNSIQAVVLLNPLAQQHPNLIICPTCAWGGRCQCGPIRKYPSCRPFSIDLRVLSATHVFSTHRRRAPHHTMQA